jgi:hypothetical protein
MYMSMINRLPSKLKNPDGKILFYIYKKVSRTLKLFKPTEKLNVCFDEPKNFSFSCVFKRSMNLFDSLMPYETIVCMIHETIVVRSLSKQTPSTL